MSTDRDITWCLPKAQSNFRLKPLPVLINKVDASDGSLADIARQSYDVIEASFGWRIKDLIPAKRIEPRTLVRWKGRSQFYRLPT